MARLTMSDRRTLAQMYAEEKSVLEIATKLRCHPQTIYEELKRGATGEVDANHRTAYDPELGQKTVQENIHRCGRRRKVVV